MKTKAKRFRTGRVVNNKMQKTVTVAVDVVKTHFQYMKQAKRLSKYKAHDEKGQCAVGDIVRIEECRPISSHKAWFVAGIVQKAGIVEKIELKDEELVKELNTPWWEKIFQ